MKKSKHKIILNAIMVAGLMATSGCWTEHGNQPGGDGEVGGSFGSIDRPMKAQGAVASTGTNNRVSDKRAQLAMNGDGHSVAPINP